MNNDCSFPVHFWQVIVVQTKIVEKQLIFITRQGALKENQSVNLAV